MAHGRQAETRLAAARERLRDAVAAHGRTRELPLADADGRVLAAPVDARRNVPHYDRAAMDGYAVRAADTEGATPSNPRVLSTDSPPVGEGQAARVHTGSALPEGADAVARVEKTTRGDDGRLRVTEAVPEGKDVAPVGEDVTAGQRLFEPGHRLRPSDLGLLRAAGQRTLAVAERPSVAVLPTGEEVVDADPDVGEAVETNGRTVASYVERWGGTPARSAVVDDDAAALRDALEAAGDADLVATIGGSSVGDRDLVPDVLADVGDVFVRSVAVKPGHPVALGRIGETPVVVLPGYPVSCIVGAVQFLRPALAWLAGASPAPLPAVTAELADRVETEPGVQRFVRVRFASRPGDSGTPVVEPVAASGAGVLSSVALADGWLAVPEETTVLPAGATVSVQDWEYTQ